MKIEHTSTTVTTNANFAKVVKSTIDEASLNHIFGVLTNIYSDPAKAVVQEYASNGFDSHVLAGQDRPVEVTFPSYLNSSFIVRDFGVGMSRAELEHVYSKYGASTKRNTNDQIGAFGLGAKSALALTNSFTVNSVQAGKRNVVIVSKDEEGGSSHSFLAEEATEDADGVTITIPVPNPREFERVLKQNIFIGWKPGTVLINGEEPDSIYNAEVYRELNGSGWYEFNTQVRARQSSDKLRAVIGPVLYTIPSNIASEILKSLGTTIPENTLRERLVLNLPNGGVSITPNREELIFNSKTKTAIQTALTEAADQISEWVDTVIETADSRKDAAQAAQRLFSQGLMKAGDVSWRGEVFGKAVAVKSYYGSTSINFDHTFAASEIELAATEDEGRLFESTVYWGSSRVNGDHLRTRKEQDGFKVLPRGSRYIIVTEATRDKRGYFESDSKITAWAKVDGFNNGGMQTKTKVLTTTRAAADLPKFMTELALRVVTAADVVATAKANPDLKRHAAKSAKTVAVPTLPTIAHTLTGNRDKGEMLTNSEPERLSADVKYVVVQASGTGGEGERNFENAIYSYFRAPNNGFVIGGTEAIVKRLAASGYSIVVLPATSKRESIEAALPNVTGLDEAVADVIGFDGTESEKDYFRHEYGDGLVRWYHNSGMNTRALVGSNFLENITNEVTRDFIALCGQKDKRSNEIAMISAFTRATTLPQASNIEKVGAKTAATIENLRTLVARPARSYPLLKDGVPDDGAACSDAADYINLCDKKAGR